VSELHWLSAAEASRAYAARRLSPVELLSALLARIDRLDPRLHAFTRLDAEAAMDAARAAEAEIAKGRVRGPLHGVPVGVKDIIDVAGLPTTCHSKILLDNIATADSVTVGRLRQAGAIILGKLATHEFAIGGPASICPSRPRATRGTPSTIQAARRPAPAPGSAPGFSRLRSAPTQAARCAIRPARAASSAEADLLGWCRGAESSRCRSRSTMSAR
jgi:aspartyl-tRNA(Asn)/glutamyl-tRNA(Gln) amidotransferase subunit A